ncbi:hypothetical protein MKJ04_13790 [Pontibacter sp. E15-1]|uniref:hypothetical protein n=1 Tax=Pontibacter sp. E15-1 TaxID=2919918 RepID=UPI001F501972|nr:hypothetical protein [Pontibacter sp. E15-1]MCJ8165918.1 hypothetical protein [Pontibacter sp. E15-1]
MKKLCTGVGLSKQEILVSLDVRNGLPAIVVLSLLLGYRIHRREKKLAHEYKLKPSDAA